MKQNATIYTKVLEKGGKKYRNLIAEVVLDNGEKVDFQIKLAFYNKKFAYKISKHLCELGGKNETTSK